MVYAITVLRIAASNERNPINCSKERTRVAGVDRDTQSRSLENQRSAIMRTIDADVVLKEVAVLKVTADRASLHSADRRNVLSRA